MTNAELASVYTGECPFGYGCKAMDCEECLKIRADSSESE